MGLIHVKAIRNSDVVTELFLWFSGELCGLLWQHSRYCSCRHFLQILLIELLEPKCTFFFHAAEPLFQSIAKLSKKIIPLFIETEASILRTTHKTWDLVWALWWLLFYKFPKTNFNIIFHSMATSPLWTFSTSLSQFPTWYTKFFIYLYIVQLLKSSTCFEQ
jgi:hypothetical protein